MWGAALIPETPLDTHVASAAAARTRSSRRCARPEIAENALALDINQLDVRLAREAASRRSTPSPTSPPPDSRQPLSRSATNPFCPLLPGGGHFRPIFIGGYGQSLSNVFGGNFPDRAGRRADLAAAAQSDGAKRRPRSPPPKAASSKAVQDQIGMAVEADVRNALQAVNSAAVAPGCRGPRAPAPPKSSTPASSASSRPERRACSWCCNGRPT